MALCRSGRARLGSLLGGRPFPIRAAFPARPHSAGEPEALTAAAGGAPVVGRGSSLQPLPLPHGLGAAGMFIQGSSQPWRAMSSSATPPTSQQGGNGTQTDFTGRKLSQWEGPHHNFPDYIDKWGRKSFYVTGAAGTAAAAVLFGMWGPGTVSPWLAAAAVAAYWRQGMHDLSQKHHTIKYNFPVLGNVRYIMETIRPEIRQYFIESDSEATPFSRFERTVVYQRAKEVGDSQAFGTRHEVYQDGYEFVAHSLWPKHPVDDPNAGRVLVGGKNPECTQPYSSSIFNISAMSYGALSDNAILALNTAAAMGQFSHNTGEGGISRFHRQPGGDIVWNVGTGYFGCRKADGAFCPEMFEKNATLPQVKMIEIKISQGAKPAHGGMLPGAKVTQEIAEARGIEVGQTCNSPATHSAFEGPRGLCGFIKQLRQLSGGKPVGFKLCVGRRDEFAALVHAMLQEDVYPDFITVDGGEGGTGAAPPEFSNCVGSPLRDGLAFIHDILTAAGIRDKVTIIASGKALTGFSLVRCMSLGADVMNSARAMMFALGCIQALKCNTNKCPTGITTLDQELMKGLDVDLKSVRVYNFHRQTVKTALEIMGAAGAASPTEVKRSMIMMRPDGPMSLISYEQLYPCVPPGCLVSSGGSAPPELARVWIQGESLLQSWDARTARPS